MKAIGGYFELEKFTCPPRPFREGVLVNSGRNALEYILRCIGKENIDTVYIPLYTCEVVLEPFVRLGIKYEFYHIGLDLKPVQLPLLGEKDYIVVNNYYGIQDAYVAELTNLYFGKIIVDNSQALYAPVLPGQQVFFSPRKFAGLPDGGIAYAFGDYDIPDTDNSDDRVSHLIKRTYGGAEFGYQDFHKNSKKLANLPLRKMSQLTKNMLERIDFPKIAEIRKENYNFLRSHLEDSNHLKTPKAEDTSCPMVYPYMTGDQTLRNKLISNKIFVATYWPNVREWCIPEDPEYILAQEILPLPIDQRYTPSELSWITCNVK